MHPRSVSGIILVFLALVDRIDASFQSNEYVSSKDNIEILGSTSLLKKRNIVDSVEPVKMARSSLVGCLKRSNTHRRPNLRVKFGPEVVDQTPIDPVAEKEYFSSLLRTRLDDSDAVYAFVNDILKMQQVPTETIDNLFIDQPQVFIQTYQNGLNVFQDASQQCIDYVINRFPRIYGASFNIFKEVLRNSSLTLPDKFYKTAKVQQLWKMIELADQSGRPEIISHCYLLPITLNGFINESGETFLTEAVKSMNLHRIRWLLKRKDATEFLLTRNIDNENAIDLAVKLFDENIDKDYSVFRQLFSIILNSYKSDALNYINLVLREFVDNCREADENEIIISALKNELTEAIEFAEENDIDGNGQKFVQLLESCISKVFQLRSNNIDNCECYSEESTEIDEPSLIMKN